MKTPVTKMIGRNVRVGMVPGGMTNQQCVGTKRSRLNERHQDVIEAANKSLEKWGWRHQPDPWRDAISQAVVEARAKTIT